MTALLLAALMAASDPSPPPVTVAAPPPAQAAKKEAKDPDKVICHFDDNYGSRMKTRTCKTRAQWERDEANAQAFIKDSISRGSQVVPASTAPVL